MQPQKIAIGIVKNESGEVLVTQRKKQVHLPEHWEFPGGKLEAGESFKQALRREIGEEIGVQVKQCFKLIDFNYRYDDRGLYFQVYVIDVRSDEVVAKEQQNMMWLNQEQLDQIKFPAANQTIINAINLPQTYMIADHSVFGDRLVETLRMNLEAGISQIQLRAPDMHKEAYIALANQLYALCHNNNARLIVNCDLDWYQHIQADGIHLNSQRLESVYKSGTISNDVNIHSASCHSLQEIEYANALNVSAVLIGPVQHTPSHPERKPLGWPKFSRLCALANMPVYAIGGLGKNELATALVNGAKGIAGIRDFDCN